jgi:hypothetical protein
MADLGIIVAIVGSAIAIVGVIVAMFFWVRAEANNDRREFQNVQRDDRKDLLQISRNIETTIHQIHLENKEFHQRLLDIEKRKFS